MTGKKIYNSDGRSSEDKALDKFAEMMIEKIKTLQNDWKKPWFTDKSISWPRNLSGREYNGMNALLLMMHCEKQGYKQPVFCTFDRVAGLNYTKDKQGVRQQIKDNNGQELPKVSILKGEKSFPVFITTFTVVDKETKEKLAKDIEKTDLIGNQYVSEEKEFEGYKLVSKPESNVHIYKEKKQEFSYEYEKIKFKITTKVEGEGGTIEGDEIVKYGEDSSKDKIKIKAKDGYEINKITINGESYEITDRNEIIMPYFKEVKEDKEVIVSFVKKIENPKTIDNIMSYIGYALLSIIGLIISGIVLIKNKTQEKI